MDKKISQEVINSRRKKKIVKLSITGTVVICVFVLLMSLLKPSLAYDKITVSTVDRGTLNVTVSAVGKVIPFYEEVITSPVASKILSVYKKAGDSVNINESILELDLVAFNADIEKQRDELEIKRSKLEQQRLSIESIMADFEMQIKIDEMKLRRMEVQLRNERHLDSIGASTTDKIKQAELEFEVQTLQLDQLKQKYRNQQQTASADIKVLELEYRIAEKNASLLQKTMGEAQVRATRSGTLTWVNDQIGANVASGSQLAIISDLKNYKIQGEISDNYADKISPGHVTEVKIGATLLKGIVENVVPSVSDGKIEFIVRLEDSANSRLRSGLKVDIYVVNSIKDDVLTVDNRSYYIGAGDYDFWVINGNKAQKRKVRLGEASFDKVEVVDGLSEGDQIIVSDMSRFNDKMEMQIKK